MNGILDILPKKDMICIFRPLLRISQRHRGTLPSAAVYFNPAITVINQSLYNVQSQTGAFSDLFGREKWFEDVLQYVFRNSFPLINDSNYEFTFLRVVPTLEGNLASIWHGIAGVVNKLIKICMIRSRSQMKGGISSSISVLMEILS